MLQRSTISAPALAVNGRFQAHCITGVQRYAHEIVTRLGPDVDLVAPRLGKGAPGHIWEQTVLPARLGGRLLWSPCGSGPIGYRRQVVTFHDLFPIENPEWYSVSYRCWYSLVMRRLAARALCLIAVSRYTKSRLVSRLGCNPDNITVIPNGVSRSFTRADADAIGKARKALRIPTTRYILSLSSLEKRKNLGGTLFAWSQVRSKLPADTWLVLAGPKAGVSVFGRQEVPLHEPRVFSTGYVPEEHLAGLYSGASLFLFPSFAEGFGLPLLEAMACGARCIASNTTSLPEVGGDAVEYIDPTDDRALPDAILRIWSENGASLPHLPSIERAKRFTWGDAARRTRDVLHDALERNPRLALDREPVHDSLRP